jgi:hypothetical protein
MFLKICNNPEAYRIDVAFWFCAAKQRKHHHSSCANAQGLLKFEKTFLFN